MTGSYYIAPPGFAFESVAVRAIGEHGQRGGVVRFPMCEARPLADAGIADIPIGVAKSVAFRCGREYPHHFLVWSIEGAKVPDEFPCPMCPTQLAPSTSTEAEIADT
jgi:hypothetical protein